ncbi:RecF/RecN/SMC N terminal domain-containing protein [Scheffersomyces amazonensis]|uniref:RecF/RecN/SMC N terminal domain-containing protein n=1 Tax=Scheffersomyces amazonensis TaxID=1078765 RepID=UPI00315CBBA2
MGRLVGLELHNFKSYKGTARIGFGTSYFTSIIGPNGAGKSNMMDAISFVLGVKSSHLRSQNLKELIYRGRKINSNNSETNSLSSDEDPINAYVMAVYEKDDGEIIKLKRTISSNGIGDYKINDLSVTALNYSMVLKSENILIKARNFLVFQGDVEQIASQSPQDLTKLIENISGSIDYIKEYDQLKEEYEKSHEYSNSVFSRKRNLNSESKQYKVQLAEQEEFEEKLIKKTDTIKNINLYKLYHNEKKHEEILQEINLKNHQFNDIKKQLISEQKLFTKAAADYSKQITESKRQEKFIDELSTKIESTKRDLIPIEASKRSTTIKVNSYKSKIKDLQIDLNRQNDRVIINERQLREAKRLFNEFQDRTFSSIQSSVTIEGQREYEELRNKFLSSDGSKLEEEISLLLNDKESILNSINNSEIQKSNSINRINELESNINTDLKSRLGDINQEINDILSQRQEKFDFRSKLIKAKDEYKYEELQINTQLRDVLIKLDELSYQQRESNKQKRLRENVSTLKRLFPEGSIKGILYELVRPIQHKYEGALSTVLGRNFDSVIVETSTIAYKCIEILKERRLGVISFIPLDNIINDTINLNYLRSIHPGAQPAIDIIEYEDKSLEQAINYVMGDTLVVNNINIARELKWSNTRNLDNRIVTLDGSVIHKSGLMTGGQQDQKSQASINWDKNEFNNLTILKDDLADKLSRLHEKSPKDIEINLLAEEISRLDDKMPVLRNQKLNIERIINDRESDIKFLKDQCHGFDSKILEKKKQITNISNKIEDIQINMKTLQQDIYGEFCNKYGFKNGITDYEDLHGSSLRIRAKERSQFTRSITTLTNKLNFEKEAVNSTNERINQLQNELLISEKDLEIFIKSKRELEESIDSMEAELEILKSEHEEFVKSIQSQQKYSRSLETSVQDFESQIDSINKSITGLEETLLKIDNERVNYLKNCKIQSINIPLKDGLLESISIGENIEDLMKEVYEIEIDYSLLPKKYQENFSSRIEAELEAELEEIINQLEKLTPNLKAVDRLNEIENKLKDFDRDYTMARQQERKIFEKFQEIRNKRYDKFLDAFNHISNQIDNIYKELTKSRTSPVGGSAYLTLEDEEEPYNSGIKYHAMPPMKRFRDMEFLSGGEKTMAALALLFAIHSYQPSPFFVLDEIDAALDNSNVSKIANYIRKYAGPNFQFIVISLKNSLFERSDALVGIYREQRQNSSRTVTLDLTEYSESVSTPIPTPPPISISKPNTTTNNTTNNTTTNNTTAKTITTINTDPKVLNKNATKALRKALKGKVKSAKGEASPNNILHLEIQQALKLANIELSNVRNQNSILNKFMFSTDRPQAIVDLDIIYHTSEGEGLGIIPKSQYASSIVEPDEDLDNQFTVVKVPKTLVGDKVKVLLFMHHLYHAESKLLEIIKPSPQRNDDLILCNKFKTCSGCHLQMLSHEDQINFKFQTMKRAYEFFFPNFNKLNFKPVIESPKQYGYRSKLTPHYTIPKPDIGQTIPIGYNDINVPGVILDVDECPIGSPTINDRLKIERLRIQQERPGKPGKSYTLLLRDSVKLNNKTGEYYNVCLTDEDPVITEKVENHVYQFNTSGFFQNNPEILPSVLNFMRHHIDSTGYTYKYLIDTYCGVGFFGIALSNTINEHGKIFGIEVAKTAIEWATKNAKLNSIPIPQRIEFISGSSEMIFESPNFKNSGIKGPESIVIMDPSRRGSNESFMRQLLAFKPRLIIYVSCNVFTQARDLALFEEYQKYSDTKYKIKEIAGFDFFPQTKHVETIAVLELQD